MLSQNWILYKIDKEDDFLIEQLAKEALDLCNQRKRESIFEESKALVDKITLLLEKEKRNDRNYKLIFLGMAIGIAASFNLHQLSPSQLDEIENLSAASVISSMKKVYYNIFLEDLPLPDAYAEQIENLEIAACMSVANIPDFASMTREQLSKKQIERKRKFNFFAYDT